MAHIQCPQHGLELEIHRKCLEYHGVSKQAVIGKCPECEKVFVNRTIFPSCPVIQMGRITYEYLPALNREYPPEKTDQLIDSSRSIAHTAEAKKPKQTAHAPNKKPKQTAHAPNKKPKQTAHAPNKKPKQTVHTPNKKPQAVSNKGQLKLPPVSLDHGEGAAAKKIFVTSPIPSRCPYDREPLTRMQSVRFTQEGFRLQTNAVYCSKCRTAFLTRAQGADIHNKLQALQKRYPNPALLNPDAYHNLSSQTILSYIPILKKQDHCCPFCEQLLQSTGKISYCISTQEHSLVYITLELRICRSCGVAYADQNVTRELLRKNYDYLTLSPDNFSCPREMMEAAVQRPTVPKKSRVSVETQHPVSRYADEQDLLRSRNSNLILKGIPYLDSEEYNCPFCRRPLNSLVPVEYTSYQANGNHKRHMILLWECSECHAVYAALPQQEDLKRRHPNPETHFGIIHSSEYASAEQMMTAAKEGPMVHLRNTDPLPFKSIANTITNISHDKNNVVQVYANKCHCQKCSNRYLRNTMENRTALVNTVRGDVVKINVMYCKGCGQYFVSLPALQQYRQIYGGLLAEFQFDSDVSSDMYSQFHFAPDSILSRCGYTVKSGISEQYRHIVLAYLLDSGKARKYEIIEKINSFIRIREHNPIYANACDRWRQDIRFVSNYHIDHQKFIRGVVFKPGK